MEVKEKLGVHIIMEGLRLYDNIKKSLRMTYQLIDRYYKYVRLAFLVTVM